MTLVQQLVTIGAAAAATVLTRALPFFAFPPGRPVPAVVTYLGRVLPGAVFGLLVVYCLRDVDVLAGSHGAAELVAVALTAGSYLWRRNMLLSIAMGTGAYMLLVNGIIG